ncbi:Lipoamide acyltransferase component of branched-chain alpha-keto acid dehydrogenase complex [Lachnellula arida]|uniref:Dihydrolipoamide acetyltransferase component of pyruvate dehydrogenase complex n=1 Tax=Lachnellula arida TaxID=1316785 RepID=A0A8T9BJQ0_9HELO|nr:Lipoamide acyltransferase component of branched-chain alpha-keto acid dehydrogenase complex [Lachnellula arida]
MKKLNVRVLGQSVGRPFSRPSPRRFTVYKFSRLREFHQSAANQAVKPYLLADIGEGITQCQVVEWFVKPGDRVEQFDRICEVQSDKASVEITSRWDGTIKHLHYEAEDMAIVGQASITLRGQDDENEAVAENTLADEMQERAGPEPQISETPEVVASKTEPPPQSLKPSKAQDTSSILLIPSVRHMIKDLDLNVAEIVGTGKNGRISKEDVLRYKSTKSVSLDSSPSTVTALPSATIPTVATAEDRSIPLTPTQSMMFKTMTHSLTIPHFLYTHSVDLTSIESLRKRLNLSSANGNGPKLTPLPFILKALSHAFTQMPHLNAHLDTDTNPEKPQLLLKGQHNFGIAVDTAQGLLVPVIKNVQAHSINSLAAEILKLGTLANEKKLGVEDFKGGTCTVSNIGSIGGGVVSPIIVAPQVCIVAIGRAQTVPRLETNADTGNEVLVWRKEVVLSWSADHRIIDGAAVARCAEIVTSLVEDWGALGVVLK